MSLLVPTAPGGPHRTQGAGDGASSRHQAGDGDFAAALAETAGEEVKGKRTGKSDAAAQFLRAQRRLEARGHGPGEGKPERAQPTSDAVAEPRLKAVRDGGKIAVTREASGEAKDVPSAAIDAAPQAGAVAAREALAALGADMTMRPEATAASAEGAPARGAPAVGDRSSRVRALEAEARGKGAEHGPEVADEAEHIIQPVRVVRQETHFQPAGAEARRWQSAQDSNGSLPTMATQGADAKTAPAEPAPRERMVAAVAAARASEVAPPVAQPAIAGGEVAPGSAGLQIADRVQQALGTPSDAGSPPATNGGNVEPDTRQTFAPAVRTIKLQLNPATLGAVTIVLSGSGDGLRVDIAADLAETVGVVENDRAALTARLAGAGYSVSEVAVTRLAGQAMDGDARDHGARQPGSQDQFGNAAREGAAHSPGQQAGRGFTARHAPNDAEVTAPHGAAAAHVVAGVSYAGRFRPI